MERLSTVHKISTCVLIGITVLASIALVAEMLPEVKAKIIVIPTLVGIITWTLFHLLSLRHSR